MKIKINLCYSVIGLICCLFWLSAPVCLAGKETAYVKTMINPMDPMYAGQRIPFHITLYAKTRFIGSPRFELPHVPGLILMKIEDRPVMGSTKEGDDEFLSKTHEFAAFPQQAGQFSIPSFTVSFAYMDISTNTAIERTYKTNEIKIDVKRPPGTDSIDRLISTSEFKLQAAWDPKPLAPKVGDAFKMTITRTAKDIPGMVFLPVSPEKIDGIGVYETPPLVEDHMERGEFSGKRVEIITYVCEEEGRFEIPGLTFYWFDLGKKELKKESLNPVVLKVAPNPQHSNTEPARENKSDAFSLVSPQTILLITGISLIFFGWFRNKKAIVHGYLLWKQRRAVSEKAFFKAFEKTCRSNDDEKTLQALFNWLYRLEPATPALSIKDCFISFYDPALLAVFIALEKRVYGASGQGKNPDPGLTVKLLGLAKRYRKHYFTTKRTHRIKANGLRSLNP